MSKVEGIVDSVCRAEGNFFVFNGFKNIPQKYYKTASFKII